MSPENKPCDLPTEFVIRLDAGDENQVTNTSVGGPHIEVFVDGPDGANRLLIFTGIAILNVEAKDDGNVSNDGNIHRGNCVVRLDFPLTGATKFIRSASNASLGAIRNDDTDTWLFAVDCVSTQPARIDKQDELVLTAALAIASDDGDTALIRMAYQANVLVRVEEAELDSLLVSDLSSGIPPTPPQYFPNVAIFGESPWGGKITLTGLPTPPGAVVALSSSNPSLAPVPSAVLLTDQTLEFIAPRTSPVILRTDITITASFRSVQKTAIVTLLPPPR